MRSFAVLVGLGILACFPKITSAADAKLLVGFAEADITPDVSSGKPVWIAGYGHGRKATGVHDPIMARSIVLKHGQDRIALVAVDLVGLQYPEVQRVRAKLNDYCYVLVASTHNHEGPDVIGIWGSTPFQRGVDEAYLDFVVDRIVQTVRAAEKKLVAARASYGTATDESLLRDSREPQVKDGVVRILKFVSDTSGTNLGLVTQFSCHPESLSSRNTQLTADFPYATVAKLKQDHRCPVVYLTGAVGGLMTNPTEPIRDHRGVEHRDGTFEYAQVYGDSVADLMTKAVQASQAVQLAPFVVSSKPLAIPVENKIYRAARELGVLQRAGLKWTGNPEQIIPLNAESSGETALAMETEVVYLRLGEVHIAGIPGELYPELVYGSVQNPADPGSDFPDAPIEPAVTQTMPGDKWLIIGLANDEIGYIIPRRQWDEQPPFCYGRAKSQYGEINSCGPSIAPIIMQALLRRVEEAASR